MVKEAWNGRIQKNTAGFGKSMMKCGKSMVKEERNGEIPLNFGISSYFWSFHHAFFSDLF